MLFHFRWIHNKLSELLLIEKRKTLDIKEKFLQAHELLMKPVISIKDNPVKQISNFGLILKK